MNTIEGLDGASDSPEPNEKAGILQEINNSSRRTKKQSRPRIDESFSIFQDEHPMSSPKQYPRSRDVSSGARPNW